MRLGLALLFGPSAAPLPFILLESNPFEAFVVWLTTSNDFTQTATGFSYPITWLVGLPLVLALGKRDNAGFIPAVGLGAILGLACWMIAFFKNPRADGRIPGAGGGRVLGLNARPGDQDI